MNQEGTWCVLFFHKWPTHISVKLTSTMNLAKIDNINGRICISCWNRLPSSALLSFTHVYTCFSTFSSDGNTLETTEWVERWKTLDEQCQWSWGEETYKIYWTVSQCLQWCIGLAGQKHNRLRWTQNPKHQPFIPWPSLLNLYIIFLKIESCLE